MFTGIIEALGRVKSLRQQPAGRRLTVVGDQLDLSDVGLGGSIAVNGCCLTVVALDKQEFTADVSNETLRCTTLGALNRDSRVNLEKAMVAGGRFGGHIVSGHVDGAGSVTAVARDGDNLVLEISMPDAIARYVAAKGSIAVDGVSLTVNRVDRNSFSVNIIPHTRVKTIAGGYRTGTPVNLEIDVVARYLERLAQFEPAGAVPAISLEKLRTRGFPSRS